MDNYRSTSFLDDKAIARRAFWRILGDPVTWVPLLPGVAAYTLFDIAWVPALIIEAMVLVALAIYWRHRFPGMMEALRSESIREHNRLQDAMLAATIQKLRDSGAVIHAERLTQFLRIKREVERRLYEDDTIDAQKMRLEHLVDTLCFGVRDELSALAEEGHEASADSKTAIARIDAAFTALQNTVAELDTILEPTGAGDRAGESIEELTQRLREEAEIARRVQARLRADESHLTAPDRSRLNSN